MLGVQASRPAKWKGGTFPFLFVPLFFMRRALGCGAEPTTRRRGADSWTSSRPWVFAAPASFIVRLAEATSRSPRFSDLDAPLETDAVEPHALSKGRRGAPTNGHSVDLVCVVALASPRRSSTRSGVASAKAKWRDVVEGRASRRAIWRRTPRRGPRSADGRLFTGALGLLRERAASKSAGAARILIVFEGENSYPKRHRDDHLRHPRRAQAQVAVFTADEDAVRSDQSRPLGDEAARGRGRVSKAQFAQDAMRRASWPR